MNLVKQLNLNNNRTKLALAIFLSSITTSFGAIQIVLAQQTDTTISEESLLPPEIVPLDPITTSTSANSSSNQMSAIDDNNTPGMVMNDLNGMQTAKDFRQSAFNSLYGQGELNPQVLTPQWRAQQGNMENSYPASNALASNQPAQSQTLTGGVKYKPVTKDIRRSGVTNTLSALAGFGAGALTSAYLMRPQYAPVGLGIFGLTMTGFGVRNGFRF
jgi:hypothetical protein